jgi:hypothetical protein
VDQSGRDPVVVDGPLGLEPRDGVVDGIGIVSPAREALSYLCFRELASGQELQRREVRVSTLH